MMARLGDIAEFINGGAWSDKEYTETGIPVVKVTNLKNGTVDLTEVNYIPESSLDKYGRHILRKGDLVIATVGSHPNLVASAAGRATIIPSIAEGALLNQNALCLRTNSEILHQGYLGYLGKSDLFQGYVKSVGRGAANQVRIALGLIKEFSFNLPPLPTQRKIASILSAYDDLIENNLKRIKLLEEKAFLRYKSEFDFFKPSNEINKIPEGWVVKRADEIFKINIGKTPPREQSEWFNDEDSKVKWVSIKDINNSTVYAFETSETVTEMAVSKFNMNVAKAHTVLLSFKLTVGKVAITTEDTTTNEAIAHFNIEDENQMCSEYIYFYLKNFPYDSLGSTSSIGTAINSKVVKAMPVLLPPKKVINDYKKDVVNDFKLIQNLLKQNTKLREARDILLPKLMNGQIEV